MSCINLVIGWKDFENNVLNRFQQLWNDKDLTDVTLVSEDGKQLRAHKMILSSGSYFFQNVFQRNTCQDTLLYLKDINYRFLHFITEFIYTGQCDIEQQDLVNFLSIGKNLGVTGLLGDIDNDEIYDNIEKNKNMNGGNTEYKNDIVQEVIY